MTTSSEFRTGTLNTNDVRNMTDIQLTESERRESATSSWNVSPQELHQRLMEMF